MAAVRDDAFTLLAGEVRRTFHQLAAAAEALHAGDDAVSAPQRAVLESLWRGGDQTVPALARARPVSRQHIQTLVNELVERRLVETVANPAHRRSPLVRLTAAGRARFEAMRERERTVLSQTRFPATRAEMLAAADTLRRLREHLARELSP